MRHFLTIILLIFLYQISIAQNYNIKHYTVKNGLLHSFVNDIIQDKRGNVWIATGGGLCVFNGVNFRSYTTKHGLHSPRILSLAEDDHQNLWIGSSKGLNIFKGDSIYTINNENIRGDILDFAKSKDGYMWILTRTGVFKVNFLNDTLILEKLQYNFGEDKESIIFQDRTLSSFILETTNNNLFIGFNQSVFITKNGNVQKLDIDTSINVYTACETEQGEVLFGTNKGVFSYKNNAVHKIQHKLLNDFEILKIATNSDKLWMLGRCNKNTLNEVCLLSMNPGNSRYLKIISSKNGLIKNPTDLFIDHENNVWTCSNGGLSVLKGEIFTNYSIDHGLVGNKIWGIHEGIDNNIWLGTIGEGLSVISGNQIKNFTDKEGLPDSYIGKIYQDKKDVIYFGTGKRGLYKANYSSESLLLNFQKIDIPAANELRIDDILRDQQNRLWVASSNGLYYSENNQDFIHVPLFRSDTGQVFVQKLFISSKDKFYIGTKNHGLFIKEGDVFRNILTVPEKGLNISSICEDNDGNVWVSSQGKGILRLPEGKNKWITENDGLRSNVIYILQSDSHGNMWIGSNLGLDKLSALKYNSAGIIVIRHYDTDDGLEALEMNLNGSVEDHEGNVWFATNNGVVKYDYKSDINNRISPITNLLSIHLHSKATNWTKYTDSVTTWNNIPYNPILPYNENHVTFNFVGISYKNPKEIKYTWILEGFDNKWVPVTENRQAIYSNLPPGKYKFRLKSANSDDVWNNIPVEFKFEILPPFWATWWFRSLSVILIITIIVLIQRWRLRSMRKRQKELKRTVEIRTKEITIQKDLVEAKNREIIDSINYAKRLQSAILPPENLIIEHLPDSFIIFKPKDVVSGDFYWFEHINNVSYIAVADCTGHGVPGAMVSVVCSNALYRAIKEFNVSEPGQILDKTRELVIETFAKSDEDVKDGMDIALCSIHHESMLLQYAGANSSLYMIRENELEETKPDKQHIGKQIQSKPYTNHKIQLKKGDIFYLFSDGYADQFGGPKGRKFLYKPFKKLLLNNHKKTLDQQVQIINQTFDNWMGNYEQVDDVCILGIKI